MIFKNLRAARVSIASLLLFALSSCASLPGGLPSTITDALGQVTGFSSSIADWKSSLGGAIDAAGFSQLKDFAGQAGSLGDTIGGLTETVSGAMSDPMKAIGDKLTGMAGLNVESLKSLAPTQQMDAVTGFTDSASGVGDLAADFLKKFSN